jgi:hypothetical protein
MAKVITIFGESGSGKTTAMRTLDPKVTYYIDCDKKGLSWKGWRDQYSMKNKNFVQTDFPQIVKKALLYLNGQEMNAKGEVTEAQNKDGLKFKYVVIDTLNGLMIGQEFRDSKRSGFDKWNDLANYIWEILDLVLTLREDLTVIFICHSETVSDDNGIVETHIKTSGRKLRKMVPESKMNTVLLAEYTSDGQHVLWTRKPGTTAKAPMGAFEQESVDNDIQLVIKALADY